MAESGTARLTAALAWGRGELGSGGGLPPPDGRDVQRCSSIS